MNVNIINVCFICDDNYALATRVAILSLLSSKNNTSFYNIYIICVDTESRNQYLLDDLMCKKTKNYHIHILYCNNKYKDSVKAHWYVSKAALMKFCLPNLLCKLDKVLYLDSDVLVFKDLLHLYSIDLKNHYLAAVRDIAGEVQGHAKKIKRDTYFNSGVMLLNLKQMRKDNITKKLINQKRIEKWHDFMDQDVMNRVLGANIIYLPIKYNMMRTNIEYFSDAFIANKLGNTIQDIKNSRKNPVILHLTNRVKPWDTFDAPGFNLWLALCDLKAIRALFNRITKSSQLKIRQKLNMKCKIIRQKIQCFFNKILTKYFPPPPSQTHF